MQTTIDKITIPDELIERNQWVMHKSKIPYQINGEKASPTDPNTWTSYDSLQSHIHHFDGVGFVLTENDPYTVIDLDNCIIEGTIQPEAKTLVDTLDSYTEYSQSGNGLHIFIKGKKLGQRSKNADRGIEIYDNKRFIVMTGKHVEGTPLEMHERQDTLNFIYDMYLGAINPIMDAPENNANMHSPQMSDQDVINKIRNSKHFEKFSTLYDKGDIHAYHGGDDSAADFGLANILAFWTQDGEQLERIMRKSALYRPEKWDRRESYPYIKRTIDNAVNDLTATYQKQDNYQLHVKDAPEEGIKKGSWWLENENKTRTFLHDRMAKYVLQEYKIARFPDKHGDIYIYNESTGIYEIDKTCRYLRSIIRQLEFLKNQKVREVQEYIIDTSPVVREETTNYVAIENGLLELESMEFKEFTPDVFVTSKIPTKYNPDAYDEFVEDTLKKVSDNHEPTINNICEMFGAVLYPKLLVPKMFYLYGRSAHNGKSTVLTMVHKTFNNGSNMAAISPQKLADNTFAASSVYGRLANIVDDQPDKNIEDSGTLKTIITGGYIDIEAKNKDSRTVQMNTVCITASNHFPNFKEYGNQINKRLYIIPFDHDFMNDPEVISEMESMKKLGTEGAREYVLKLAVEAIKAMTSRSENVLTYNEKVNEASEEFAELNDPLTDYFAEFDKNYFEETAGTRTYEDYLEWCSENNIRHTLGLKKFKIAVSAQYNMVWKDKKIKLNGRWVTKKGFKSR